MVMNQMIKQVLSGRVSMDIFLKELENDQELQGYIRNFVPKEAKGDCTHHFWKIVPYQSLQRNDFDYYKYLFWAQHSKVKYAKHLNIFSRLQTVYQYYYPEVQCTNRYEKVFDIYLDAIKDCFDGPEVQELVERIIADSMQLSSKAKRTKQAQMNINSYFHVEKNKRPRWVQGPEWPMGNNSPMAFVAQKRFSEAVLFEFRDVDTGETRVVKQFY